VVVVSLIIQYTKEKRKTILVLFPNVATGTYGAYEEECLINFIYGARLERVGKLLSDIGLILYAAEGFIIHVALRLEDNNKTSHNLIPFKNNLIFTPTPFEFILNHLTLIIKLS
jgi:hypothetical protein